MSKISDNGAVLDKLPVIASVTIVTQGHTVVTCDYSLIKNTIDMMLSSLVSGLDVVCLSNQDEVLISEGNYTVSDNYIQMK